MGSNKDIHFEEFDVIMENLKKTNERAWAWAWARAWAWAWVKLISISSHWSNFEFSHFLKNNSILNNYCEQSNSKLLKMRVKLIITMAEESYALHDQKISKD